MEGSLKIVATVTIVTASLGLILLIGGLFSATWIKGDLQPTSVKNITGDKTTITNTSGSCSEGLFVQCCQKIVNSTYTTTSGYGAENSSDHRCYIRGKSDFHGQMLAGYQGAQALAALSLICTFLGMVVTWLFRFVGKLQETPLVPLAKMVLFYLAVLLLTIVLIVMGANFKKFTSLIDPKIGASIYVTAIAEVVVLAAGILSTVAFVLVRKGLDGSYGHF